MYLILEEKIENSFENIYGNLMTRLENFRFPQTCNGYETVFFIYQLFCIPHCFVVLFDWAKLLICFTHLQILYLYFNKGISWLIKECSSQRIMSFIPQSNFKYIKTRPIVWNSSEWNYQPHHHPKCIPYLISVFVSRISYFQSNQFLLFNALFTRIFPSKRYWSI